MLAHSPKQEALDAIQRLPDNVDMEEIMYRLYVLENIRKGQEDAEQGKTTTAEQVLRDIQAW
jgi:predicted transcriptional regulator